MFRRSSYVRIPLMRKLKLRYSRENAKSIWHLALNTSLEKNMHFVDAKGILTGGKGHYGMNIYRGCSHGCIYCDSRSRCYQFTHAFEDIEVKQNAPELLEQALRSKRQKAMIGTGSMSDPYMHCEEQLGLTRKCLEIIYRYGFGAAVQTKSDRILRDIDLLDGINRKAKCVVQITLQTARLWRTSFLP